MKLKEYLFTPLYKENYLEFFKKREIITKSFLVITIATFVTLWSKYAHHNINTLSFWLIIFLSPLYCYTFYYATYRFIFRYNWFYLIYFFSSLAILSISMIELSDRFRYSPVVYEFTFFIAISIIGYAIPIMLSLPFKLLNHWLFNTHTVFYAPDLPDQIADELYGRNKNTKQNNSSSGKANKYDVMNETQLQIELKNALDEERFEDADLIKKALEKYR